MALTRSAITQFIANSSLLIAVTCAALLSGCGGSAPHIAPISGNTSVTLVATSSSNAQFLQFQATIDSITLTTQAGETAKLISSPMFSEFVHVNGTGEPLMTTSIPQGVYTSATITFGPTGFSCQTLGPNGGLDTSYFGYGYVPAANVTVSLPAPITVSGDTMALSLELDVMKSASYTSCYVQGIEPFLISPTVKISPYKLSSQPTNPNNGKFVGLQGTVATVDSGTGTVSVTSVENSNYGNHSPSQVSDPANATMWQFKLNSATQFQGITDASGLAAGTAVDIDTTMRPDGSLLATRIAVYNSNPTNLSLWNGPLDLVSNSVPTLELFGQNEIGPILSSGAVQFDFRSATFGVSREVTNIAKLPFSATFAKANMVAGQNVASTFHATQFPYAPAIPSVASFTLLPQTVDGTVNSISNEGGYTVYSVTLAAFDLFPALATQGGQTTLLHSPSSVDVYADSSVQMLNANAPAVGDTLRFRGMVFNDKGYLKMDCLQVSDGVAQNLSVTGSNLHTAAIPSNAPETRSYSYAVPSNRR